MVMQSAVMFREGGDPYDKLREALLDQIKKIAEAAEAEKVYKKKHD